MRIRKLLGFTAILIVASAVQAQDMPLSQVIIPGEGWKKVEGEFKNAGELGGLPTDPTKVLVYGSSGNVLAVINGNGTRDLGKVEANPLRDWFRAGNGLRYHLNPARTAFNVFSGNDRVKLVKEISLPMGKWTAMCLTNDRGSLLMASADSNYVRMYRIDADGDLSARENYMTLRTRNGEFASEASAICLDVSGRIYVSTKEGVQVFDPTGRLCGVILKPTKERITGMTFAGDDLDRLFIACGNAIYYRKLSTRGFTTPPMK